MSIIRNIIGRVLNRDMAAGASGRPVSLQQYVAGANRWRDGLNPQRNLTIARAVALIEAAMRGEWTELQWTFAAPLSGLESVDADTIALIELRRAALMEMDWNIVAMDDAPDRQLAADQQAYLDAAYSRIDNLYDAFAHLELAAFRGFSFCELLNAAGEAALHEAVTVRCLNPWNFVRDGSDGDWYWNPDARTTMARALGEANRIDFSASALLVRECARPINRYGLPKLVRQNLSEKDWDAFIELFGIERPIVIGPPNVAEEDEDEFADSAESVASGAGGYLPNGSSVEYPTAQRGVPPFEQRLAYLSRRHVQVGTSGMLNMLNTAGGVGGDASGALQETFRTIAAGSARYISEIFNRQFDRRLLAAQFPGRPQLAWFRLAHEQIEDTKALAETAAALNQAGLQWDVEEAAERTGMKLTRVAAPVGPQGLAVAMNRTLNRATEPDAPASRSVNDRLVAQAVAETLQVRADWLAPFFAALEDKARAGAMTDEEFLDALEEAANALPDLLDSAHVEEAAKPMRALLETAVANAIAARGDTTQGARP